MNGAMVFLGSGLGGLVRWQLGLRLPLNSPWPTLVVNIIGSLLLGWLFARMGSDRERAEWLLAGVGFCGGLTTMSTFALENVVLAQHSSWRMVAAYAVVTLVLCVLGCWAGFRIGS
ncbi:MAG: CrcB family protein [Chthonomonas sp.]|nr:CrcB family protein [Chthonomonas sp.]